MTQTDKEKLAEINKLVDAYNEAFAGQIHYRRHILKKSMAHLIANIEHVLKK